MCWSKVRSYLGRLLAYCNRLDGLGGISRSLEIQPRKMSRFELVLLVRLVGSTRVGIQSCVPLTATVGLVFSNGAKDFDETKPSEGCARTTVRSWCTYYV